LVINRTVSFNKVQNFLKTAVEKSQKREIAQAAAEVIGFSLVKKWLKNIFSYYCS
jgi:uncharacterized protein YejL (UPF0352 family)